MREHKEKSGAAAKYLRMFSDFQLVYTEKYKTRGEALRREAELKKWSKEQKELLIQPCSQCGICCKLFYINTTREEWMSGRYETVVQKSDTTDDFTLVERYGGNLLNQKKDGSCIYLKNNLCSIHEKRPQSCRNFFCTSKLKKYRDMIGMIKKKRLSGTIQSC